MAASPERTCVVCRATVTPDDALRVVLGPDGAPALDFRRKAPGRGAWVCWTRDCLGGLGKRGRLNRAFSTDVPIPAARDGKEWPLAPVGEWLERRQRELVALGSRTGQVRSGSNVVLGLLRKGWPLSLVLAKDAGATVAEDWQRKARGYELPLHRTLLSADAIGAAMGRTGPRSVLALGPGPAARALGLELKRGSALL